MSAITFAIAAGLFHLAPVQTVKKCEKIDACRCSTDEGEINLSVLGQSHQANQGMFLRSSLGFYRFLHAKNQQSQGQW